jgi:hypothetical protein
VFFDRTSARGWIRHWFMRSSSLNQETTKLTLSMPGTAA